MGKRWIVWDVEQAREIVRLARYSEAAEVADAREDLDARPFIVVPAS
jgi:hypothetical protein